MIEEMLNPGSGWFYVFILFCLVTWYNLPFTWVSSVVWHFFRKKSKRTDHQPVSVVVCARNEYHNLKKNLPQLLDQIYDKF